MSEFGIANRIEQINVDSGQIQVVDEVTLSAYGVGEANLRIKETDFVWTKSVAVVTDGLRFAHKTEFKPENRRLENDWVRSELFWGTAQLPMKHAPKFIPLNGEVLFGFQETAGVAGFVALYLHGFRARTCGKPTKKGECQNPNCKCDRARWGQGRGLFVMSTAGPTGQSLATFDQGGIAVPAGGPAHADIRVPETYHFRAGIMNGQAYNAITAGSAPVGTANSNWKGNVERMDPRDERTGTLTSAQNKQVRAAALVGVGTAPNYLPSPIVSHKANDLSLDVTDLGLLTAQRVHFAFIGETVDDDQVREDA